MVEVAVAVVPAVVVPVADGKSRIIHILVNIDEKAFEEIDVVAFERYAW